MKKSSLLVCSIILAAGVSANAKNIVECRLLTSRITECKPYPSRFMYTEKLTYGGPRHKLIISKTVPTPKRPKILKIISVEDMIENNLKVLDPVRFAGSQPSPIRKKREESIRKIEAELVLLRKKKEQLLLRKRKLEEEAVKLVGLQKEKLKKSREEQVKARLARQEELKKKREAKKREEARKKKERREKKLAKKKKAKKSKLAKNLKKKYRYLNKKTRRKFLNEYDTKLLKIAPKGKHRLRVQATAYTSHRGQTDKTPFLAAWNNHIRPGMKVIAVSRDLIRRYGLGNGKRVRIQGLPGYYTVRDKMNKRFTKRIDIYMGTNRRKALRWGRRRAIIFW